MYIDIAQAFETTPKPLDFVLPGMLASTVGAIISPGGAGKSMFAFQLGALVSTGVDLGEFAQGQAIKRGSVAFLPAEDPADALRHRLHAIGAHLDADAKDAFIKNVIIAPLLGKQPDLLKHDWVEFIESIAAGRRILFLDTLRRFHLSDENDSGDMAHVLSILEGIAARTGCAIVFLHHASKAATLNGHGDLQQASRGSSVLVDNVRWQMFMAGMNKDEAKSLDVDASMRGYFVRAGVSKQNYGKPIDEIWLRREEGGVLMRAHFATSSVTKKKGIQREEA